MDAVRANPIHLHLSLTMSSIPSKRISEPGSDDDGPRGRGLRTKKKTFKTRGQTSLSSFVKKAAASSTATSISVSTSNSSEDLMEVDDCESDDTSDLDQSFQPAAAEDSDEEVQVRKAFVFQCDCTHFLIDCRKPNGCAYQYGVSGVKCCFRRNWSVCEA